MEENIDNATISELFERQNRDFLRVLGGIDAFKQEFETDLDQGLSLEEESTGFEARKEKYGVNVLPESPKRSWFSFFFESFHSIALRVLFVSALVSFALVLAFPGAHSGSAKYDWRDFLDTIAIFFAVLIVMVIEGTTNYVQQNSFAEINKMKNEFMINVIRGGVEKQIPNDELVVGDVLSLKNGDKVAADSLYITGHHLKIDNSQETGESVAIQVDENFPFVLGGAAVESGDAHLLVCAVGEHTQSGINLMKIRAMSEHQTVSPLQRKLNDVTKYMTWIGLGGSVAVFIVLLIKWGLDIRGKDFDIQFITDLVGHLMVAITIFICTVPEGLPLATTLSLGFSMKWMVKDAIFVRHLSACETMGGATTICSDKTGTLTQNKMTVYKFLMNDTVYDEYPDMSPEVTQLFCEAIAINTSAYQTPSENGEPGKYIGQSSECALLQMLPHYEVDYKQVREQYPIAVLHEFNSSRKRMSTVVHHDDHWRVYAKGAPDYVLQRCTHYITENGEIFDLNEELRNAILDHVIEFADNALRTILVAYGDLPDAELDPAWEGDSELVENNLTFIGIAGIIDPLRPEVKDAIAKCKRAGVMVRMVTGDYINTAKAIAKECGIYDDDGIAMTGLDFSSTSKTVLVDKVLPKLQVLARSSPRDKYRLVGLLMEAGEVVAVTGDGSNDSPALKRANVGLAMGKCGTELAKMASDIVILDDNFSSIVSALRWGRCVYDNVRGFLQYQLVVNFSAMVVAFFGSILRESTPLKAIQLLWINLLVGPMGSLCLATAKPVKSLLDRSPYGEDDPVISLVMVRNIIGQVVYQLIVLFIVLFGYETVFHFSSENVELSTNSMCFNTFVYCQVFNLINARVVGPNMSMFEGLFTNVYFICIFIFLLGIQVIIMFFAGEVFQIVNPTGYEWLTCVLFGFGGILIGALVRLIPVPDRSKERLEASRQLRVEKIKQRYVGMSPEDMWEIENTPSEINDNEDFINP